MRSIIGTGPLAGLATLGCIAILGNALEGGLEAGFGDRASRGLDADNAKIQSLARRTLSAAVLEQSKSGGYIVKRKQTLWSIFSGSPNQYSVVDNSPAWKRITRRPYPWSTDSASQGYTVWPDFERLGSYHLADLLQQEAQKIEDCRYMSPIKKESSLADRLSALDSMKSDGIFASMRKLYARFAIINMQRAAANPQWDSMDIAYDRVLPL